MNGSIVTADKKVGVTHDGDYFRDVAQGNKGLCITQIVVGTHGSLPEILGILAFLPLHQLSAVSAS